MHTAESALAAARALLPGFAAHAATHDRDASFPFENFAALHDARLLALSIPERLGGDALDLRPICTIVEEVGGACASTGLVLGMQYLQFARLCANPSVAPAVLELICRGAVERGALLNTMRVEPELGTPTRGGLPATTAHRTASGWRLSGHKIYATGAPGLAYFVTWAKTGEEPVRTGWFLVPAGTPGMRIERTWDQLGMRATGTDDLYLDSVEIPFEYALDVREPAAWKAGPDDPWWIDLVLGSLYYGIARAGRDWLVGYLPERQPSNLGASLATLPRFQAVVGQIETLLLAAKTMIDTAVASFDSGARALTPAQLNHVKYVVTNNGIEALHLALGLIGNPGLMRRHPLERHYRDVLCGRIHTPQDDTILLEWGKAALAAAAPPSPL